MLGLGLGTDKSGGPQKTEILVYSSDFTSTVDNWIVFPLSSDVTVTANETAPDSSTGWLKLAFGTIGTTSNAGVERSVGLSLYPEAIGATGWRYKGKAYFEEDSNQWGGIVSSARIRFADRTPTRDFDVNVVEEFEMTRSDAPAMTSPEKAYFYVNKGITTIVSGANLYLKDIEIYVTI